MGLICFLINLIGKKEQTLGQNKETTTYVKKKYVKCQIISQNILVMNLSPQYI